MSHMYPGRATCTPFFFVGAARWQEVKLYLRRMSREGVRVRGTLFPWRGGVFPHWGEVSASPGLVTVRCWNLKEFDISSCNELVFLDQLIERWDLDYPYCVANPIAITTTHHHHHNLSYLPQLPSYHLYVPTSWYGSTHTYTGGSRGCTSVALF